ncbi:unnamed protein product [[Candida] boidinii]|nr:unnamed protein product [[Candida] boidinii]
MSKSKAFKYNNNNQSTGHRAPDGGTSRKPQYGSPTTLKRDIAIANDTGNKTTTSNDYYENLSSLNDSKLLGESFQAGYPQREMIINDFESGVGNRNDNINIATNSKSGRIQKDNLTLRKKVIGKSPLSNNGLQIHSEEEEDDDEEDEDGNEDEDEGVHKYEPGHVSYEQGTNSGNEKGTSVNYRTPSNHLNVNSQYLYDDDDEDDSDDEDDDNQYNMVREAVTINKEFLG